MQLLQNKIFYLLKNDLMSRCSFQAFKHYQLSFCQMTDVRYITIIHQKKNLSTPRPHSEKLKVDGDFGSSSKPGLEEVKD